MTVRIMRLEMVPRRAPYRWINVSTVTMVTYNPEAHKIWVEQGCDRINSEVPYPVRARKWLCAFISQHPSEEAVRDFIVRAEGLLAVVSEGYSVTDEERGEYTDRAMNAWDEFMAGMDSLDEHYRTADAFNYCSGVRAELVNMAKEGATAEDLCNQMERWAEEDTEGALVLFHVEELAEDILLEVDEENREEWESWDEGTKEEGGEP